MRTQQQRKLLAAIEPLEQRQLLAVTGGLLNQAPPVTFSTATTIALASTDRPFGETFLYDLNGAKSANGKPILDLIFLGGAGVNVMMGNGDGTFKPAVIYPVTAGPGTGAVISAVLFGTDPASEQLDKFGDGNPGKLIDVNGDGIPDIIVLETHDTGTVNNQEGTINILKGTAGGTFTPATHLYNVGRGADALAFGDFNGEPDLVTANYYDRTATIILGNGNGAFSPNYESVQTGNVPLSVSVGDINGAVTKTGAAIPDIVVANEASDSLSIILGNGDGTFKQQLQVNVPATSSVLVEDVNGDGIPDLVMTSYTIINHTTGGGPLNFAAPVIGGGTDFVTLNTNSNGVGQDRVFTSYTYNTVSFELGYAGGLVGKYGVVGTTVVVPQASNSAGNTAGNTAGNAASNAPLGYGPTGVAVGDLNGDGHPDIVAMDYGWVSGHDKYFSGITTQPPAITIFLASGNATFSQEKSIVLPGSNVANGGYPVIDPNGFPVAKTTVGSNDYPNALVVADLNGDGQAPLQGIITANYGRPPANGKASNYAGSISILVNGGGTGDVGSEQSIPDLYGPDAVAVADVNGDGIPDLIVANRVNGTLDIFTGYGDGLFSNIPSVVPVGNHPDAIAVGDVTGDGLPDIVVTNYGVPYTGAKALGYSGSITVLTNQGNGTFTSGSSIADPYGPIGVVIDDFSGDGLPSLAIANKLTTVEGTGAIDTITTKTEIINGTTYYYSILTPILPTVSIFDNAGQGSFTLQSNIPVGAGPTQIIPANFGINPSQKNEIDLAVLNQTDDSLTILAGNGDGTFYTQLVYNFPFVVDSGNPLKPSESDSSPVSIAVADMTGDGESDVIVAYAGTDKNPSDKIAIMINKNGQLQTPYPLVVSSSTIQEVLPIGKTVAYKAVKSVPVAVTAADLNGDGKPDLIILNSNDLYRGTLNVLLNTTNATTSPVHTAPQINSASSTSFAVGQAGSFTIQATGSSPIVLSETGTLPQGVSFVNNGNGTATLSGTPAAGTASTYTLTISAVNGIAPNGSQTFTLTVNPATVSTPSISSGSSTTFTAGTAGTFTITTSGFTGTAAISESGALPSGLTLVDNGNGTATLSGTANAAAAGNYPITITANDGIVSPVTQNFTLTIAANQTLSISSANTATFGLNTANSYTITTTGALPISLSETGTLPNGINFLNNGDGTATLFGSPSSIGFGTYTITIHASSGGSSVTQQFTLNIVPFVAATPTITEDNNGVVTGFGTPGNDTATLTVSGGNLVVTIDRVTQSFSLGSVTSIIIDMKGGDDSVSAGAGVPSAYLNGSGGNDTIVVSGSAGDTLRGGGGNDSLDAGGASGNNVLKGSAGNDTLVAGNGDDTVDGGAGADSLMGGPGLDSMDGGAGPDTMLAGSGNATMFGNTGSDSMIGGPGNDLLVGGLGQDTILGGPSDTIIHGNDSIIGGT